MAGVVFSVFDEKIGPMAVFSTISDEQLTKKIAVKSIVSTLTNVQGIQEEQVQGEAILPFPAENIIAFISYATLDQKTSGGENQVISLSVITSDEDPSVLYKKATDLSVSARVLRNIINEKYRIGKPLSEEVKKAIREWGSIIEEKVVEAAAPVVRKFSLLSLFKLFPVKKSLLSNQDPLAYGFFALLSKTPLLLVGSNVEFLLEVADVFHRVFPDGSDVSIRLSISLPPQKTSSLNGLVQVGSSKIPRSSIVILNEEQYTKSFFYKDPVIVLNVDQTIETINFDMEKTSLKVLTNILKKVRTYEEETLAINYLKGEILSFNNRLSMLKTFCESGRRTKMKDLSKQFNIHQDYLFLLADVLRFTGLVPATKINQCFEGETKLEQITIHAKQNIGFIR